MVLRAVKAKTPMWKAGPSNNQAGFTLIELAVVIVIIGLMSALVMPRLMRLGDTAMDSFVRRLAATLRLAYNEAGLSGHEYRLVLDLAEGAVDVRERQENGELTPSDQVRSLPPREGFSLPRAYQPGKGMFTSGEITIRVFPVGWVDETLLHLTGQGGRELTLRINPLTGIVEITHGLAKLD